MVQFRRAAVILILVASGSAGRGWGAEPDAAGLEFFEKKIRPVLVEHCHQCHAADSKPLQGGLRVDTREALQSGGESGPAVVPGKPEDSLLLSALKYEGLQMPPKGRLPAAVVADFEKWIKMGAPDPRSGGPVTKKPALDYAEAMKFWAFQQPVRTAAPEVRNAAWPRNEIDRFVLAKLESEGLTPSPAADRRTLIRRATFDLIGLPPTPEDVDAFVNDSSPNAFEKVIDRLLDSPHYGERWGRRWLDVARYGEDQAHTFKARNYPQGWRYRDWVVNSLNADMPYDRFLKLQIAGDLMEPGGDPQNLAALGLFALGPVYYQDNGEQAKALADEHDDRLDTLARGVWGLTLACARCHDHKFDPLTMQDYYALVGVFSSSQYQERPIVPAEVLQRKAAAEAHMKEQQLKVDTLLAAEARSLRPTLVNDIPRYATGAWIAVNRRKSKPNDKNLLAAVAKEQNLSEPLLKRWVDRLNSKRKPDPWFDPLKAVIASQDAKTDLSKDAAALAAVQQAAEALRTEAAARIDRRDALFARFGENAAFVATEDRTTVPAGVIPLGNLFDDGKNVSLSSAVSSDKFKAAASNQNLGVERVVQGWGDETTLAPGIRFDFRKLGSSKLQHGGVLNDAWDSSGGIRTQGERFAGNAPRTEQGIGMHANALITFDLHEIRRAGLMPDDQKLVFRVDRAGFNDDTVGNGSIDAHIAVILSRPHQKQNVFDAILGVWVNGQSVEVAENDMTYYVAGEPPAALKADGKFARFDIPLPPDARYLTLVTTGAGKPGEENTINSDHTVLSGARLEWDPLPGTAVAEKAGPAEAEIDPKQAEQDRLDALLLSELLYDEGLLALPPADAEARLPEAATRQVAELRKEFNARKAAFDGIAVPMAHSLAEGTSKDHPLYLLGNPAKASDPVPRSLPAIFTRGERKPFGSTGSGRLELAELVASAENPLTARVLVNRVWSGHFGFGLVRTPGNFGQLGERPTHPELLDWLALEFSQPASGTNATPWSIKRLHRLIMNSATYQQASAHDEGKALKDPENRLLWRQNRRRLDVEPWRDALLAVTGELDATLGGPSQDLANANNRRRTLYAFISRHRLDDLLRLFDFPDPNITSDRRSVTTVPLQQLFVLNSGFMSNRAKALAKRLSNEASTNSSTDETRLQRAFLLLYGRAPSPAEQAAALEFLRTPADPMDQLSAWEQLALAMLGSNEFTFVD